jgi:hypothetical protein
VSAAPEKLIADLAITYKVARDLCTWVAKSGVMVEELAAEHTALKATLGSVKAHASAACAAGGITDPAIVHVIADTIYAGLRREYGERLNGTQAPQPQAVGA